MFRFAAASLLAFVCFSSAPGCAEDDSFAKGVDALEKKDFDRAIEEFSKAIRKDPENAPAYARRSWAYGSKGDFDRAMADLTEATRLRPRESTYYVNRALAYNKQKAYDRALDDLNEAVRLDDSYPEAYYARGIVREGKQDVAGAVSDHEKAVELSPKFHQAQNSLAWLLAACKADGLRAGKKALEHAKIACELTGWKDPSCLDTLAAACAEIGRFPEALKWQKKVIASADFPKHHLEGARRRLKLYEDGKPFRE